MSALPEPDDHQRLHDLIDRLTSEQARHLRSVVKDIIGDDDGATDPSNESADPPAHRFSFTGIGGSGHTDVAERSDEYAREAVAKRFL